MIGLDTNVLVRYLVQDDPEQTALANAAIETRCTLAEPGFISQIVLCELVWVLEQSYQQKREQVALILEKLMKTSSLNIEQPPLVWQALQDYRAANVDFADAVIARKHTNNGCSLTLTFDKRAARLAAFTRLQ